MSETVILCEGYHDRAFWKGWLLHLGCTDLWSLQSGKREPTRIVDPWGNTVSKGHYAYRSKSDRFIRVVPCGGKNNIIRYAHIRLGKHTSNTLEHLVINVDSDENVEDMADSTCGVKLEAVRNLVREFDDTAEETSGGEFKLLESTTTVSFVRWEADDKTKDGLPAQQTLERLVCAAIAEAYPKRAPNVQAWLDSRVKAPKAGPKEYAWSYMAGWEAEHGCEAFYACLWDDKRIAEALRKRLQESGAWRVAEAIAA